jgi:hypothetical protein
MLKCFNINRIDGEVIYNDMTKLWESLTSLYDKVLKNDPEWHMLYRGEFIALRCSEETVESLKALMDESKIEYTEGGEDWTEGNSVVNTQPELYKQVYHLNSELAMRSNPNQIYDNFGLTIHNFLNNNFVHLSKEGALEHYGILWEPHFVANYALNKAAMLGESVAKFKRES